MKLRSKSSTIWIKANDLFYTEKRNQWSNDDSIRWRVKYSVALLLSSKFPAEDQPPRHPQGSLQPGRGPRVPRTSARLRGRVRGVRPPVRARPARQASGYLQEGARQETQAVRRDQA